MLVGLIGGWLIILPLIAVHFHGVHSTDSIYDYAMQLWSDHLRYVGVGIMLIGGIWTLIRLLHPVIQSMRSSFRASSKLNQDVHYKIIRTEHDIPLKWVLIGAAALSVLLFFLLLYFIHQMSFLVTPAYEVLIASAVVVYLIVIGFLLATVCGYFTGLVGSTNNPLSGTLILALIALGIIFMFMLNPDMTRHKEGIAGFMILVTTIVATIACVSNENLQDLKAGQMVGSTPWKQQFILIVGIITAAMVIGPVLDMLYKAYGIGGVFPHPGMDPARMLSAPQANLMAAIAQGLRSHDLPWSMISIGGVFALLCIIADEYLRRYNLHLAVLAVGIGVYLPPEIVTPVIIGSVLNWFVKPGKKRAKSDQSVVELESKQKKAILLCCGLVAGAALMGVVLALPFMIMGSSDALAIVPASFAPVANLLGLITLFLLVGWIFKTARY